MLAVADLVDRDAAAEQVVGVGLIGLQANREDNGARFDNGLGAVVCKHYRALVGDSGDAGVRADLDVVDRQQITEHHIDRFLHRCTGGKNVGQSLDDRDVLMLIRREVVGKLAAGQTAADNNNLLTDLGLVHQHIVSQHSLLMVVALDELRNEVVGADGKHGNVRLERLYFLGVHRGIEVHGDSELLQLVLIPEVQIVDTVLEGMASGLVEVSAEDVARFVQLYLVPSLMRGERGLHAGNAADDNDLLRNGSLGDVVHKLSDKANIPYTTLYSIVKRKSDKIDVETLKKIALALDLHPIEIMGDSSASMVLYGMELLERAAPEAFKATFGRDSVTGASEWEPVSFEQVYTEQQAYLESRMKKAFNNLNEEGQFEACKRVEQMADTKEYQRTEPPEESKPPSDGDNESPDESSNESSDK